MFNHFGWPSIGGSFFRGYPDLDTTSPPCVSVLPWGQLKLVRTFIIITNPTVSINKSRQLLVVKSRARGESARTHVSNSMAYIKELWIYTHEMQCQTRTHPCWHILWVAILRLTEAHSDCFILAQEGGEFLPGRHLKKDDKAFNFQREFSFTPAAPPLIMSPHHSFFLYVVGIIACLPRLVEWARTPPPPLLNHLDPEQEESRRNLRWQDITICILIVTWTVLLGFTIADTLSFITLSPVVWILSITIIWLAKVYQLFFFSLESSTIPYVQTILCAYILSLIALCVTSLDYRSLSMFCLFHVTDSTNFKIKRQ